MDPLRRSPDSFLIGYPRSGTNFLQSVIGASCERPAISIYDDKLSSITHPVSLKSHAPDLPALRREINHLVGPDIEPEKLIIIFRDPRDVMISCFEFAEVALGAAPKQELFLDELFYSSFLKRARDAQDEIQLSSLTIGEAFKLHVKNWLNYEDDKVDALEFRYETVITEPRQSFRRMLDFLDFSGPIAEDKYEVKVAQYSTSNRSRGNANGWAKCTVKYKVLIEKVEEVLHNEIKTLGY